MRVERDDLNHREIYLPWNSDGQGQAEMRLSRITLE